MSYVRVSIPADTAKRYEKIAARMNMKLSNFLVMAAAEWEVENTKMVQLALVGDAPTKPTDTKPKGRPKKNPYEESIRLGGLHLLSPAEQRRNRFLMQQQWRPQWAQKLHKHLTTVGEKGWEETAQHFLDLMDIELPEGAWEEWCTERDLDPDDPDLKDTERGRMVNLLVWRDKVYEPWREEQGL